MLSDVCKDIEIEPKLTPLMGEQLGSTTSNTRNKTKIDIRARGLWQRE